MPTSWNVDADGDWGNPANWTPASPTDGDSVTIDTTDFHTVTYGTGTLSLDQLVLGNDALDITGGNLTVNTSFSNAGAVHVEAGTLTVDTFINDSGTIAVDSGATFHLDSSATDDWNVVSFAQGTGAGHISITTGGGDDTFNLGSSLIASDNIDGGAGNDTVTLDGDYSGGLVLADTTLKNVETVSLADGHDYNLTTANGNVAAGQTLTVDASALSNNALTFNGSAETDGNFIIKGGNADVGDTITTGAGDDVVYAGSGNDVIHTGAGNDDIRAGFDDGWIPGFTKVIDGGDGVDTITADFYDTTSGGNLAINSLSYNVHLADATTGTLMLSAGGDAGGGLSLTHIEQFDITFDSGDDVVYGGDYNDILTGDAYNFPGGSDELHGGGGDDTLNGMAGADTLFGDDGNDTIDGGEASPGYLGVDRATDAMHGGIGNDWLIGGRSDLFDGGTGTNRATIDLRDSAFSYTLDLSAMASDTVYSFGDTDGYNPGDPATRVQDIQHVTDLTLGSGNDTVTGDASQFDSMEGGDGNDAFNITGTMVSGTNFLDGGAGTNTLTLNGDFSTQFWLDVNSVKNFQTLTLDAGHNYNFVLGLGNGYDTGSLKTIDASALGSANGLTLDTESWGANSAISITGGAGADTFKMGYLFVNTQHIDGGAGNDTLTLNGDYSSGFSFLATTMVNVENLVLTEGNSYTLTTNDATVASGGTLEVDGSQLGSNDSLNFDGSAETNGQFHLLGGAGDDTLVAGHGADTLDGGAGADSMSGGAGNDTYVVNDSGDVVTEAASAGTDTVQTTLSSYTLPANVENLTFTGTGDFSGTGNTQANVITGGSGNDSLDGGGGADTMVGGAGNDTYFVNDGGDVVTEAANAGTDTVKTSLASYTLGANLENLTYTGTGNFTGTGNTLANVITGSGGNDDITGGGGNDTLNGAAGNDTFHVASGSNTVNGGDGNDVVFYTGGSLTFIGGTGTDTINVSQFTGGSTSWALGNDIENFVGGNSADQVTVATPSSTLARNLSGAGGNDTLTGGAGNDQLDGGTGADHMSGGAGNDTYVVDSASDVVTEAANAGTDTVKTTLASYTLGANVENLTYTGTGNFSGTGNSLANVITGSGGNDTLNGNGGADHLIGGAGNDTYLIMNTGVTITEAASAGTDTIETVLSSYTLGANIENLTYLTGPGTPLANFTGTGNTLANIITGGAGNDTLNGGGGSDHLNGGAGNDTYVIGNTGVVVTEAASAGTDTIKTTLSSYTLGANIENLTYTGTGNFAGTGNTLTNVIIGSGGNDVLKGGGAADTLTGGAGADHFVYASAADSTSTHYDTITDFNAAADKIDVTGSVTGINTALTTGALSATTFDTNLAAAVNASHLAAHHAVEFTANSGTLSGQHFLVVDLNGVAGYQANADLVIHLSTVTGTLATGDFI